MKTSELFQKSSYCWKEEGLLLWHPAWQESQADPCFPG